MENLDRNTILHAASLAKIRLSEEEVTKYEKELKDIMGEISKIENADFNEGDVLISPSKCENVYNEDEVGSMLTREEILKNANKKYGSFIAVSKALND